MTFQISHVLVARGHRLRELRVRLRHGTPRGFELRVDVGMLDLGNYFALPHVRAFFELHPRESPADFDADITAVPRDNVAARDEHRQRRRSARRRRGELGRMDDVDFRRLTFGEIRPRRRKAGGRPQGERRQHRPQEPGPPRARIAIDPQARQIDWRLTFGLNCHGKI